MKKILDLLNKLNNKKAEDKNFKIKDFSKEVLDLNVLVNNSLSF